MRPSRTTTIATVTFDGDIRLTVLQALSIDRLFDLRDIDEYLVVWNGSDAEALQLIRQLEGRVSSEFQARFRLVTTQDVPEGGDGGGWYGQQALKLAVANIIKTDSYIMLDGKNHFVRSTRLEDFLADGVPITQLVPTSHYWKKYLYASLKAMDALTDENASRMMPSVTPFWFSTSDVLALISRLESKFEAKLPEALAKTGGATEFLLYYAHIVSSYNEFPYAIRPGLTRTLFTRSPEDPRIVLQQINELRTHNIPIFGLHRNRLPQLTVEQSSAIKDIWRRNLLKEWEDADWFLKH